MEGISCKIVLIVIKYPGKWLSLCGLQHWTNFDPRQPYKEEYGLGQSVLHVQGRHRKCR